MAAGTPDLVLESVGTAAFAVSGGAVAVRAGMDWLGSRSSPSSPLTFAGVPLVVARWIAIAVALGLRLLVIRFSWSLPRIPGRV
jgi:uncharacterized membrane protein YeiH